MDAEGAEPLIVTGDLKHALSITERIVMEAYGMRDKLTDEYTNTREIVADLLEPLGFRIVLDDREYKMVYFDRRTEPGTRPKPQR